MITPIVSILMIIFGIVGMCLIIIPEYRKHNFNSPPKIESHYEQFYIDTDEHNTIVYPRRIGIDIYV